MADTKISALTAATDLVGADVPIVQGGTNKKAASTLFATDISGKQDTLVAGTNIKTINGSSILGSGDLTVSATPPDIALSLLAPTGDETITAGYSAYVVDYYEIADTFFLEVGGGSIFEIG